MIKESKLLLYASCVFDILGQRELLAKMDEPFKDGIFDKHRIQEIADETAGKVQKLRNTVKSSLDNLFIEYGLEINCTAMTDLVCITVPMMDNDYKVQYKPLFALLESVSMLMTAALNENVPLRGGIEIGGGLEINFLDSSNKKSDKDKAEIYGQCGTLAYNLEEKIAGYPRIVLGTKVVSYIISGADGYQNKERNINIPEEQQQWAQKCRNYFGQDPNDGCFILDYLNYIRENRVENKRITEIVQKGYNWAKSEKDKYTKLSIQNNQNLENIKRARYYTQLINYLDSRREIWNPE